MGDKADFDGVCLRFPAGNHFHLVVETPEGNLAHLLYWHGL